MQLAKQLSALPTNKLLTGGTVAAVVSAAWSEVMPSLAPSLAGPAFATLVGMGIAWAVAYWVPDRVNVPK
jgi:broad specificity polyphosphatase/5'/3'-nucleotidase SurE